MDKSKQNGKTVPGTGAATAELPKEVKTNPTSTTTVSDKGELKEEVKEATKSELSVEDKIRKVVSLTDHIEKRALLKNHLDRVEKLKFGDYEDKDIITITGGNRESYAIKSTTLCQKIAALVKEEINVKIKEVEAEIQF